MGSGKLRGELFWGDRWMASSAFLLPISARGLYREMLTQAWIRDGFLPRDWEAVRRAIGATVQEWQRDWPKIRKYWTSDGTRIWNETQLEILAESKARSKVRSKAGAKGGARAAAKRRAKGKPLDLDLDLDLASPPSPPKGGGKLLRRFRRGGSPPDGHVSWDAYFASLALASGVSAEEAKRDWIAERETA